jgi:hypothetical protein
VISNGNSFGMDLGGGASYGHGSQEGRDGTRPASAAWLFTVLIWRL